MPEIGYPRPAPEVLEMIVKANPHLKREILIEEYPTNSVNTPILYRVKSMQGGAMCLIKDKVSKDDAEEIAQHHSEGWGPIRRAKGSRYG